MLYFRTFTWDPVYFRGSFPDYQVKIAWRYPSQNKVGFNLEKNYDFLEKSWAFKFEGIYTPDQYFNDTAQTIHQAGYVQRGSGLSDFSIDTMWPNEWETTFILVGSFIEGNVDHLTYLPTKYRAENAHWSPSFYVRKPIKATDDKLVLSALFIYDEGGDYNGLITATFDISDKTQLQVWFRSLSGAQTQLWGNFTNDDEFVFRVRWSF